MFSDYHHQRILPDNALDPKVVVIQGCLVQRGNYFGIQSKKESEHWA